MERIFLSIDLNSSSLLQHRCTFPYPSVSQTADNKLKIHHLTGILEMMFLLLYIKYGASFTENIQAKSMYFPETVFL